MIKAKDVFLFSFVISLIAYNFHWYLWTGAYDQLMSICYSSLVFTVVMMSTGQFFWLAKFVFLASVINVLDEFILYPCKAPSVFEYVLWLLILTYYFINYKKWKA